MEQFRIAVASLKGGVSKTTVAINLAGALVRHGQVLLVDEDEGQSALNWADIGQQQGQPLPFMVVGGREVTESQVNAADFMIIDLKGGAALEDLGDVANRVHLLIVPCGTSGMEVMATDSLIGNFTSSSYDWSKLWVLVTRANPIGSAGEVLKERFKEILGPHVFETVIRSYVAHQFAAEQGCLVRDVDNPNSRQAWRDVESLAKEVIHLASQAL
jgi:chromosome partitioning protein